MDADHFDHLAKALAAVGSRRRVLGVLLGGTLGAARGWRATRAAPPPCVPEAACEKTADCCPTETCNNGTCTPTRGSDQATCLVTGCPVGTNQCQEIVCDQRSGECVPQNLSPDTLCELNMPNRKICCGGTCCDTPAIGAERQERCCPTKLQPSASDFQCQPESVPCPVLTS